MDATILSIGDELISGLTLNTNAVWLARQLAALGISIACHVTVGDSMAPIVAAMRSAITQSDLILITGGLGPTEDDLTRQALAQALGEPLVEDTAALAQLTAWFASRNRAFSPSNLIQAQRPRSAACIENTTGTAPGLMSRNDGKLLFVMPGVPKEMMAMFSRSILPLLQPLAQDKVTLEHKINTFGVGESIIGERIKDLMAREGGGLAQTGPAIAPARAAAGDSTTHTSVGTSVHDGVVSIRIYATGSVTEAQSAIDRLRAEIQKRLGPIIFGHGDETIDSAAGDLLKAGSHTISTAESCTGGLIAALLTNVPGSSAWFARGWVTYSNQAKTEELGVDPALIAAHGAVSEPVALAMAAGALERSGSTYALAATGVAGPDGGSVDKPVGTVWLALAGPDGLTARRFIFPGDRSAVRLRAAQMSLTQLRLAVMKLSPDDVLR